MKLPSLRCIRPVIRKEFRQIRRDVRSMLLMTLLPAFMLFMFGFALNFDVKHIPLAVVDQDVQPSQPRPGRPVPHDRVLRAQGGPSEDGRDAMDGTTISIQAYVFVALVGTALGGYLILIYAMMGNVVDYDELLTNRRREAIYYGTFSFAIGLGTSVGTLILPVLLENFGYTQANPLGVRLAFPVMAVFVIIGYFIFQKYRIGDTLQETKKNLNME